MMDTRHVGSSLDEFLEDEGLLAEAEILSVKRVIAWQLQQLMESQQLTKTALARRMNTSRASLDRLLDPANTSVTLQTMGKAAVALGTRLHITLDSQ